MDLLYKEDTFSIIGAAIAMHKELGNGFLEAVYQEALEKEFQDRKIPYKREVPLTIYYKNKPLKKKLYSGFHLEHKRLIKEKL